MAARGRAGIAVSEAAAIKTLADAAPNVVNVRRDFVKWPEASGDDLKIAELAGLVPGAKTTPAPAPIAKGKLHRKPWPSQNGKRAVSVSAHAECFE